MTVPWVRQYFLPQTSVAATVDVSQPMFKAPYAGVVTLVEYVPAQTQAAATAVAATVRTYTLYNRVSGAGTTVIARGAITSLVASQTAFGTGFLADQASTLPLNATTTFLTVAAGDILEWESSHSDTGLRDVGGLAIVTFSRI